MGSVKICQCSVLNLTAVVQEYRNIFRFSFTPRTIGEWNKLPKETVTCLFLSTFKSKLFYSSPHTVDNRIVENVLVSNLPENLKTFSQ